MCVSLIDGHIDDDAMTDNEIIKALECHSNDYSFCMECPFSQRGECSCELSRDALSLINCQKAEIERLKKLLAEADITYNKCAKRFYKEGVTEFAERLKDKSEHFWEEKENFVSEEQIDNLVKEMVGEG